MCPEMSAFSTIQAVNLENCKIRVQIILNRLFIHRETDVAFHEDSPIKVELSQIHVEYITH